jgi:hypothetical protein
MGGWFLSDGASASPECALARYEMNVKTQTTGGMFVAAQVFIDASSQTM